MALPYIYTPRYIYVIKKGHRLAIVAQPSIYIPCYIHEIEKGHRLAIVALPSIYLPREVQMAFWNWFYFRRAFAYKDVLPDVFKYTNYQNRENLQHYQMAITCLYQRDVNYSKWP
jgi:hypothetical protein